MLEQFDPLLGATVPAEVALVYDDEVDWGIELAHGPRGSKRDYVPTCLAHYRPFWQQGIPVDVLNQDAALDSYKLVIAPMLYLLRPGTAARIEAFVRAGGTFVTTYWSGIVDETMRCFQGGFPGPLRELLGVWAEELDVLYDDETVRVQPAADNDLGLTQAYDAHIFCDQVHAETASVLATYADQFYAGRPALTVNRAGDGRAFYVASRNRPPFHSHFYQTLIAELGLHRALDADLPPGVTVQPRTDGQRTFLAVLNFGLEPAAVKLDGTVLEDLITRETVSGTLTLPPHDGRMLERL
jgi:beta-galactosidase